MSNILKFTKKSYLPLSTHDIVNVKKINLLYQNLIDIGFSNCIAFNEAMRMLLIYNPDLELSDLSKKTFDIINPVHYLYNENNIDNRYHN